MSHCLNAVIIRGKFDREKAAGFDLKYVELAQGCVMFGLEPDYLDYWADKLGIHGDVDDVPLYNCKVVHFMMNEIADQPRFAIIMTDYFGGPGMQAAAVYQGDEVIMKPRATQIGMKTRGPIKQALKAIGVKSLFGQDAFDTIGLWRYRDIEDWYQDYWTDELDDHDGLEGVQLHDKNSSDERDNEALDSFNFDKPGMSRFDKFIFYAVKIYVLLGMVIMIAIIYYLMFKNMGEN